jgi:hypothetical protein
MTSSSDHEAMMDAIKGIDNKVTQLGRDLEYHVAEGHNLLVPREEVDAFVVQVGRWMEEMKNQQDTIIEVVLGEKKIDIDGQIVRRGGIKEIVDNYSQAGFKVQIPWKQLVAVLTASITAVAGVMVALIQRFGG